MNQKDQKKIDSGHLMDIARMPGFSVLIRLMEERRGATMDAMNASHGIKLGKNDYQAKSDTQVMQASGALLEDEFLLTFLKNLKNL